MKEYDTPMFTAHRSIGKSSENLLGFASEVFFGFSILLLALNIGIYQTGSCENEKKDEKFPILSQNMNIYF